MKNKIIVLLTIIYLSITSCQSFKVKNENNDNISFTKQFFSNPAVIYNLKKYAVGNQINILDTKRLITENPIVFKNDNDSPIINIVIEKNDFINYNVQQYTVNKDLAFVVIWEYGKNKALWFFLNKGKNSQKWYIVEILERTTR